MELQFGTSYAHSCIGARHIWIQILLGTPIGRNYGLMKPQCSPQDSTAVLAQPQSQRGAVACRWAQFVTFISAGDRRQIQNRRQPRK
jgi:hypothetical protein